MTNSHINIIEFLNGIDSRIRTMTPELTEILNKCENAIEDRKKYDEELEKALKIVLGKFKLLNPDKHSHFPSGLNEQHLCLKGLIANIIVNAWKDDKDINIIKNDNDRNDIFDKLIQIIIVSSP